MIVYHLLYKLSIFLNANNMNNHDVHCHYIFTFNTVFDSNYEATVLEKLGRHFFRNSLQTFNYCNFSKMYCKLFVLSQIHFHISETKFVMKTTIVHYYDITMIENWVTVYWIDNCKALLKEMKYL